MQPTSRSGLLSCFSALLPDKFAAVLGAVDMDYAVRIATELAAIGTYERGFRPAGSAAAHRAARWLKAEMEALGLADVHMAPFPVDGWEFSGASVSVLAGGPGSAVAEVFEASSYGGAAGTPRGGIERRLIPVGPGRAADYAGRSVAGQIVLVGLDFASMVWASIALEEAKHQGAAGVIIYNLNGGAQTEGALHSFDLQGTAPLVPVVNVPKRDGERLLQMCQAGEVWVRLENQASLDPRATAYNIIGYIPGTECPEELVLIGDHFDAWFTGFLDDAVGVGAVLALAKAMRETGYRPRRTLAFVLHDAEEYGKVGVNSDWCIGAYYQSHYIRPEWAGRMAAAIIFELCGWKDATRYEWYITPDLRAPARAVMERLKLAPVYPDGWHLFEQAITWEDTFCYTIRGIPSAGNLEFPEEFKKYIYHTQFDTAEQFDPVKYAYHLAGLGLLALELDQAPALPIDLASRAEHLLGTVTPELRGHGGSAALQVAELAAALRDAGRLAQAAGQKLAGAPPDRLSAYNRALLAAAGELNRGLTWLGGPLGDRTIYPWEQELENVQHLTTAIAAARAGNGEAAAAALRKLHGMGWGHQVSYPVYRYRCFMSVDQPDRDLFWANGRLSHYVDAWHEYHAAARGAEPQTYLPALEAKLTEAHHALLKSLEHAAAVLRAALDHLRQVL